MKQSNNKKMKIAAISLFSILVLSGAGIGYTAFQMFQDIPLPTEKKQKERKKDHSVIEKIKPSSERDNQVSDAIKNPLQEYLPDYVKGQTETSNFGNEKQQALNSLNTRIKEEQTFLQKLQAEKEKEQLQNNTKPATTLPPTEPEKPTNPPVEPPVRPTPVTDYSSLQQLVTEAKQIQIGLFVSSSVEQFVYELLVSEQLLIEHNSTQNDVDTQVYRLQLAINNLVLKGNKSELYQLVTEAESHDSDFYNSPSIDALKESLILAKATLTNSEVSQNEVDRITQQLKNAIANLDRKTDTEIAKIKLQRYVDSIELLNSEDYTMLSYQNLQDQLSIAKNILISETATTIEVEQAHENLTTAKEQLIKRANKEQLHEIFLQVEELNADDYEIGSWETLQSAYNEAKRISDDTEASQELVDEQVDLIQAAIKNLVAKASEE